MSILKKPSFLLINTIVSTVITLVWWRFLKGMHERFCYSALCGWPDYPTPFPEIIEHCCQTGSTASQFFYDILITFLLPFVTTFLVISLIWYIKNKLIPNL